MRKARAGFLVVALVAASTTPLCFGLAFAQQLPAQAAASQPAPEADAPQSAQEGAGQDAARPAVGSDALDACPEPNVCIDQYLWSLYERTPKVDTIKVEERIKVKVKNKGKTRTVVKTLTKYINEDFGWKDPKAAQKAGMSLKDT